MSVVGVGVVGTVAGEVVVARSGRSKSSQEVVEIRYSPHKRDHGNGPNLARKVPQASGSLAARLESIHKDPE